MKKLQTKKLSFKLFVSIFFLLIPLLLFSQDYLESVTDTFIGTTTIDSKAWSDLGSISIDVTNVNNVLLTASINMRPDGASTAAREANYRIYRTADASDNSGVIERQIKANPEPGVESWGIGTLVYIFDVSSLTGTISFTLEHSNQGGTAIDRNVYSSARLTAVALTTKTNNYHLNNDVTSVSSDVTTSSSTFGAIAGTTTSNITLPYEGDFYVAASINNCIDTGSDVTSEYQLQYSLDGGSNWNNFGKPVKRTVINTFDEGIISLVDILSGQTAGANYQFRVVHRRVSGDDPIISHNINLVAIALNHSGGRFFPSFKTEVGTSVSIVNGASAADVVSTTFTTLADVGSEEPDLFVNAQFLVSAANLDPGEEGVEDPERMRAGNQLFVYTLSETEYFRYIPDNANFGSGGTIGLVENLDPTTSYTISMKHRVVDISNQSAPSDETLTTSEVILAGFQTFDKLHHTLSVADEILKQQLLVFINSSGVIQIQSEKPLKAAIELYNVLGQKIATDSMKGEQLKLLKTISYKGIVFLKISTDNATFSKKMLLN